MPAVAEINWDVLPDDTTRTTTAPATTPAKESLSKGVQDIDWDVLPDDTQRQPTFLGELGRAAVEPFKALVTSPKLLLDDPDELYLELVKEHARRRSTGEGDWKSKAGGLLGGLGGGVAEFGLAIAAASETGPAAPFIGPGVAFGASGSWESFVNAGVRAIDEKKPKAEVLRIAMGMAPVGAAVGAGTAVAFGATGLIPKTATAVTRVLGTGAIGAAAGAGGQLVENVAERGAGLDVSPTEGLLEQAAIMGLLPIVAHARDLYRQARGVAATDPVKAKALEKEATDLLKSEIAKAPEPITPPAEAPKPPETPPEAPGGVTVPADQPKTPPAPEGEAARPVPEISTEAKPSLSTEAAPRGAALASETKKGKKPDAKAIRSDTGQPSESGTQPEGVKEDRGGDLQQPTPRPSDAPTSGQAPGQKERLLGTWPESQWTYEHLKGLTMGQRSDRARFLGMRTKDGMLELSSKKLADRAKQRFAEMADKPVTAPVTQAPAAKLFFKHGNRLTETTPEEASGVYREMIEGGGFGASQVGPMILYDANGKPIGRVSYNGAVWLEGVEKPIYQPTYEPGGEKQAKVSPERIISSAYRTPEGKVETGANHPEILARLGIKGFETRESRNTEQFGFTTDTGRFITREEAGKLATASGQNLETFDPAEPVHSDQIASPVEPTKALGEVPQDQPPPAPADRKPDPNWQVTVQEPQVPRDKGYIQIDDVSGGKNKWSSNPEALRVLGYDIPDLSQLKTGKYKLGEVGKEPPVEPAPPETKPQTERPPPPTTKEVPATDVIATLSASPRVKVSVPEGATQLRITDTKDRKSVQPIANVNKGDNPFRGVEIAKVEAGSIGKEGKFRPVQGEILARSIEQPKSAIPTGEGHTIEGARAEAEKAFGPLSDRVSFVHEPDNPSGAYTDRNKIVVNAAKVAPGTVEKVLLEEGLHGVWNDPDVQSAWKAFKSGITEYEIAAERAKRKGLDTSRETLKEEAAISKLLNNPDAPFAKRVWDAIIRTLDKLFGVKVPDDRAQLIEAAREFLTQQTASPETDRILEHPSVPLSFIDPSQQYLNEGVVQRYQEAIRNNEPMEPISVAMNLATGRFSVDNGHHRYEAAKREGLTHVPVKEIVKPYERNYRIEEGIGGVGQTGLAGRLTRQQGTRLGESPGTTATEKIRDRPYSLAARPIRKPQPDSRGSYQIHEFPSPEAYGQWVLGGRRVLPSGRPLVGLSEFQRGRFAAPTGGGGRSAIEQYTEALRGIRGERAPLSERFKDAFNIGSRMSGAKDLFGRALAGLKATGDWLVQRFEGVENIDDLKREKGLLSASTETRGWQTKQFVREASKATPRKSAQAAISKYIDTGGDMAKLRQGEAETPNKFKQAYRDAQKLTPDQIKVAEQARTYFEAKLDEAIDAGILEDGVADYIHRMYERRPDLAKKAMAYVQSGVLKTNPALAKARVFSLDYEAEKAGFEPVQSFIERIAEYETSLSRAIASRRLVAKSTEMRAPDGRPVIDIKGVGIPITDEAGERTGTLIKPQFNPSKANQLGTPNYRGDYVNREYPALSKWKWVSNDAEGKPIFVQGDVAIHPEFVHRFDALLEPSRLRYGKYAPVFRPALAVSSAFKQTMLDLSGFHQVQISVHALEHRVNPLKAVFESIQNKPIDFQDPNVDGLLKSGLTIGGDYRYQREGLIGQSLIRQVPILGPIAESYHNWLFQDFIPRIKLEMAQHALERNRERYKGQMTDEQILFKTAQQANDAFGGQNTILLERSRTAQDIARLIMLAPDFLESRGRFAASGLALGGKRFGNEQRTALLLGALTLYTVARVLNKLTEDQYHFEPENVFSWVHKGQAYSLRTVQGDILHLLEKPLNFWMHRLNPVFGRTTLEAATGRDEFGRKRSTVEQLSDFVSTAIPISLRTSRERTLFESFMNAFGVTDRRWQDTDDAFKLAKKWKADHGVGERGEFIYDPEKDPLRGLKVALSKQDDVAASLEIKKLIQSKAYTMQKLDTYFARYRDMPFTGSRQNDRKWESELSDDQKKTVEAAKQSKKALFKLYIKAKGQYQQAIASP